MYDVAYGSVRNAGQSICDATCAVGDFVSGRTCAAYRSVVNNRREILVTILLLAMIAALTHFILYTDPAKTRAYIHSIPVRVHAWYKRQIARKWIKNDR